MKKSFYLHETRLPNGDILLFHTLLFTKGLVLKRHVSSWITNNFSEIPLDVVQKYRDLHLLVENGVDSTILNEACQRFSQKAPLPPTFFVLLTNSCNLRCPYCFEMDDFSTPSIFMGDAEICSFVGAINASKR